MPKKRKASNAQQNLITRKSLKQDRGWTDALVKDFLPAPAKTVVNWHHRSGPPVQYFDLRRIKRIEVTKKFQKSLAATQPRKQAAQKAVATKETKLQRFADTAEANIEIIPMEMLRRLACEEYNANRKDGDSSASTDGGNAEFLDRITVNYMRHRCSRYEPTLQKIRGKVGVANAYLSIKTKVLDEIAEAYPELAAECYRQAAECS